MRCAAVSTVLRCCTRGTRPGLCRSTPRSSRVHNRHTRPRQSRGYAALQILTKRVASIGLWRVVGALSVELAGTGQLKPSLEVLGDGLVEQSPLGVARVVEFGLCTLLPARMRIRLRWAVKCLWPVFLCSHCRPKRMPSSQQLAFFQGNSYCIMKCTPPK